MGVKLSSDIILTDEEALTLSTIFRDYEDDMSRRMRSQAEKDWLVGHLQHAREIHSKLLDGHSFIENTKGEKE